MGCRHRRRGLCEESPRAQPGAPGWHYLPCSGRTAATISPTPRETPPASRRTSSDRLPDFSASPRMDLDRDSWGQRADGPRRRRLPAIRVTPPQVQSAFARGILRVHVPPACTVHAEGELTSCASRLTLYRPANASTQQRPAPSIRGQETNTL